jgi:hypothetical protein
MNASLNALHLTPRPSPAPDDALGDVVDRLFGSGLVLTRAARGDGVSEAVRACLHDVIDELDAAIAEVRSAALAGVTGTREARVIPAGRRSVVTLVPDIDGAPDGASPRRCLRRVDTGEEFAYAMRGTHFFRASDGASWARQRGDTLVATRSGAHLAQRVGQVFYDVESHRPLYYESVGEAAAT